MDERSSGKRRPLFDYRGAACMWAGFPLYYTYRLGNLACTRQGTEHKRESEKRNLKGKNAK